MDAWSSMPIVATTGHVEVSTRQKVVPKNRPFVASTNLQLIYHTRKDPHNITDTIVSDVNSENSVTALKMKGCAASPVVSSKPKLLISPTEIASIRVPELRCSIASSLHPQLEEVRTQCEEWIVAMAQPSSSSARDFIFASQFPRLLCRCLPDLPQDALPRLVQIIKMVFWLFIVADDKDDDPDVVGADYASISDRARKILTILHADTSRTDPSTPILGHFQQFHDPDRDQLTIGGNDFIDVFGELWAEIRPHMSPAMRARFIATMAAYFDSVKVQSTFRKANCVPDTHIYIEIRRQVLLPVLVLVEYALGMELDTKIYSHPLLVELHNTAIDFVNLCNDIISCPIEASMGNYFNLPCVLHIQQASLLPSSSLSLSSSLQQALETTVEIVHALNVRHDSIRHELLNTCTMPSQVSSYVNTISSCMSGCLAWFLETTHYQPKPIFSPNVSYIHHQNPSNPPTNISIA